MNRLTLYSPAKINLFLKVLGKRPDGFHDIETIFHRISLKDTLRFKKTADGKIRITTNHPQVPVGRKNLVYRVGLLLQKLKGAGCPGAEIHIEKKIPVAAGLAGGSTNAASALLGLNQLWGINLSNKQLVQMGSQIGSDVPFFLYNTSYALGVGRGTLIKPLKITQKFWFVVVVPKVKLYASEIYGGLKLKLTKNNDNANILIHYLRHKDINALSDRLCNDLEEVVLEKRPGIVQLKQKLKQLKAKAVLVSGSGPSVFGLMQNRNQAEAARHELAKRYSQVFVTTTL